MRLLASFADRPQTRSRAPERRRRPRQRIEPLLRRGADVALGVAWSLQRLRHYHGCPA